MNRSPLVLLALLINLVCCQSNAIDISLNLKKGDSFKVSLITDSEIDQVINGQKNKTTSKMTIIAVQNIDSVLSNGDYLIAMRYDLLHNEMKQSLVQNPQQDELSQVLNKVMVGKTFWGIACFNG